MALVLGIVILGILIVIVYRNVYFESEQFQSIKESVTELIKEFNDLNIYADRLSLNILGGKTSQFFVGQIVNESRWNYRHSKLFSRKNHNKIYHCSRTIVSSAQLNGFKYVCKYFNIPIDEEHRNLANEMLNNFISYSESRKLLEEKRNYLFSSIEKELPFLIRIFKQSLYEKLGLIPLDLKSIIYPCYTFWYTSSGGNSELVYTLKLDEYMLEKFIDWMDEKIKFKKSTQYQRIIMTKKLREKIKKRDNYCCKKCGISTDDEPTLLLEIDHIIPISKGGMSDENNLQCLCWKCNRSKGNKIV